MKQFLCGVEEGGWLTGVHIARGAESDVSSYTIVFHADHDGRTPTPDRGADSECASYVALM